jgi:hypothetical protein
VRRHEDLCRPERKPSEPQHLQPPSSCGAKAQPPSEETKTYSGFQKRSLQNAQEQGLKKDIIDIQEKAITV